MPITAKIDEFGKPAWIALVILGFMVWWPLGLAALAFAIGSGRMGCRGYGMSRWTKDAGTGGAGTWWQPPQRGSGNRAFDEYRSETLRRLETSSANSTTSLIGFAWPRTSPSSISSWPIGAIAQIRTLLPQS